MKHLIPLFACILAVACGAPVDQTTSSTEPVETDTSPVLGTAWRAPPLATAVCQAAAQCDSGWAFDFVASQWRQGGDCPAALMGRLDGGTAAAIASEAVAELQATPCDPQAPAAL